ncbi:MAG TPA: AraC family transcriptional regulator [Clostridiales bacterium]|nr:AraC family transcriptional regulator [Clostridiales bacterium]HOL90795.1 AraC family transcriptional regulator [Clostridiales bacterium]HPP34621.1 AraC family transcriptional regulator [Clostridiales bacterium]
MDYKNHIKRAIDYIEENLKNEITIADCAKVSGYSNYHFIRVFKEATGLTPADYIRKRRLTEIVRNMRKGVPVCEIAFEYGFNSKENFTRAFFAEHHILPSEYKAALNSLKLYEPIIFEAEPFEVKPELTYLEPFELVVYKSDEDCPPKFWNKYNSRKWSKKLTGGKTCADFGVCVWNQNENKLDYFIGVRKSDALGDTGNTIELTVPGGLYAVFATPQSSHFDFINTIHRTWDYIYNEWLPNSGYEHTGGCEFETYIESSRTYSEKIYIPLKS